jgi:hypothetical protein
MFSRAGRRMGRFRPFISRRILRELALAPVFPNRRNAMTDLAAQATSLGLANEFELLAREYEADAASLESASFRR